MPLSPGSLYVAAFQRHTARSGHALLPLSQPVPAMPRLIALALLALLAVPAAAQPSGPMVPLAFLAGEWEGEGWIVLGPDQRHNFVQHETVTPKLGGDVLLIEGVGRAAEDTSRVVHNALAVLAYDPAVERYLMRAFRADGPDGTQPVEADVTVEGGALVWAFEAPQAGRIRYTIREDEAGRWHEVGEISQDGGATWFPFFEMTLTKVE